MHGVAYWASQVTSAPQACLHWHNRPHRHDIICRTYPHTRSCIIRHTGLRAVARGPILCYTSCICHTACMQVQKPLQRHARTTLATTPAHMQQHIVPHMRLHNLPYSAILVPSATQARMQLHNMPHMHACRCIIYRAGRHALHYLPYRHACSGIIGHTGTALSATHTLTHTVA